MPRSGRAELFKRFGGFCYLVFQFVPFIHKEQILLINKFRIINSNKEFFIKMQVIVGSTD